MWWSKAVVRVSYSHELSIKDLSYEFRLESVLLPGYLGNLSKSPVMLGFLGGKESTIVVYEELP